MIISLKFSDDLSQFSRNFRTYSFKISQHHFIFAGTDQFVGRIQDVRFYNDTLSNRLVLIHSHNLIASFYNIIDVKCYIFRLFGYSCVCPVYSTIFEFHQQTVFVLAEKLLNFTREFCRLFAFSRRASVLVTTLERTHLERQTAFAMVFLTIRTTSFLDLTATAISSSM